MALPVLMVERDRRKHPVRYFRSYLAFTFNDGRWEGSYHGHEFFIEKRTAEPGNPAGWYYFGPGRESGEYAGPHPDLAAETVMAMINLYPHLWKEA